MNKDEKAFYGRKDEEFDPFAVVGDRQLSAWQVDANHSWIQARSLSLIRQLRKNTDCRRVAYAVAGGILETFEIRRTLPWVAAYLERLRAEMTSLENPSIS